MVAALVKLGSKHIQQITKLTAVASAVNVASFLMAANSINTLCKSDKSAAKRALAFAMGMLSAATLLRGTTVLKTRHISCPALIEFAKLLVVATTETVLLAQAGIIAVNKSAASTARFAVNTTALSTAAIMSFLWIDKTI